MLAVLLAAYAAEGKPATPAASDADVRQSIIEQSIADYKATGHPCACPYDVARNGSSCGRRSAYSRPGGTAPLCYPNDVTAGMVQDWRAQHQ
jgi:hypothetical protein